MKWEIKGFSRENQSITHTPSLPSSPSCPVFHFLSISRICSKESQLILNLDGKTDTAVGWGFQLVWMGGVSQDERVFTFWSTKDKEFSNFLKHVYILFFTLNPAVSILYDAGHDLTHTLKKWKNNFLNLQ